MSQRHYADKDTGKFLASLGPYQNQGGDEAFPEPPENSRVVEQAPPGPNCFHNGKKWVLDREADVVAKSALANSALKLPVHQVLAEVLFDIECRLRKLEAPPSSFSEIASARKAMVDYSAALNELLRKRL